MSNSYSRPSRVIRIADHLDEYVALLAEEVGCKKAEALDAILEDWLERPRDRQPVALITALRKYGDRWSADRFERIDVGVARDSVTPPKTASDYLKSHEC